MQNSSPSSAQSLSRRWSHRAARYVLQFHGSAHQVAGGVGLGMFVAFTPTFGVHMILAFVLATLLRANRAAAVALVWVTNPFTAIPIYLFCYRVGRLFMPGPGFGEVRQRLMRVWGGGELDEAFDLLGQLQEMAALGGEILWPTTLGGILVGAVAGSAAYLFTLGVYNWYGHLREKRRRN